MTFESYYQRNRDRVLQRQRERRQDPIFREKQRAYCEMYYKANKDYIIARARSKRLGIPFKKHEQPKFEIIFETTYVYFD